ncbi:HNH endonuclease [Streptomyces sp. NPDC021093]|uniref:HNH endonuclease n=1 Tax=Streptomyces sp. NPDC021093 TaxID=3365112 RepID=UPI0037A80F7E
MIELSELLRALPLHEGASADPKFRSVGSVSRKTTDLASNHPGYSGKPTRCGAGDRQMIEAFLTAPERMFKAAKALDAGVASGEIHKLSRQPDELDGDGSPAIEGRLLVRWATSRERDPKLRRRKLDQVRKQGLPFACEVCEFVFAHRYGALGDGYIEVHHTLPLHIAGPRATKLQDLALVCSNCHRMCHRSHKGASWRTPAELRALLAQSAQSPAR